MGGNGGRGEEPDGAIDRALAVLDAIADAGAAMGVSEIARQLSLPKSVVHYHLRALARHRYLQMGADRRYELGPAAVRLGGGRAVAAQEPDLRSRALPHLRALQEETHETVTLAQLVDHEGVFVDQVVGSQELKVAIELGRPMALHVGSSGRAILAHLPSRAREAVLAHLLAPVDPAWLRVELDRVRHEGVATSRGEDQPGPSVAAPVFGGRGVIGAVGLCGPAYRFIDAAVERFKPPLKAAAARLSRDLGWRG